jgi:hypothetical protein
MEEGIDPVTDGPTDNARRRGGTESRHDGKHVGVQEWASACFLRGLVPRPSGTAVYGPVRTGTRFAYLVFSVCRKISISSIFGFGVPTGNDTVK